MDDFYLHEMETRYPMLFKLKCYILVGIRVSIFKIIKRKNIFKEDLKSRS